MAVFASGALDGTVPLNPTEVCTRDLLVLSKNTDYWGFVGPKFRRMYLAGNDDGIAIRFFNGLSYEPQSMALWMRLCRDVEWAIDIGAHTGVYSLAAMYAGAKNVLSIEPYWASAARLMLNLRANGRRTDGVRVMAASDHEGIQPLSVGMRGWTWGYCSAGASLGAGPRSFPVETQRVDNMLPPGSHRKVGVVKIDIERHSPEAVAGMPRVMARRPDLVFEAEEGLEGPLKGMGYHFYEIDERTGLSPVDHIVVNSLDDGTLDMNRRNRYATVNP